MPNWVTNIVTIYAEKELQDLMARELHTDSFEETMRGLHEKLGNPSKRGKYEDEKSIKDEIEYYEKFPGLCINEFDFNSIVPMPPDSDSFYASGGLGTEEHKKFGKNNWYDWSVENWGTKWNSHDACIRERSDTCIVYEFLTAWSCPEPIIRALSRKYGARVRCSYYDEDFGSNVGVYAFNRGWLEMELCLDEDYEAIGKEFGYELLDEHGMKKNEKTGKWEYCEE